jgi:hypothetical protein
MADLIPQSEYRKELNKNLLENERIQKENLERERMAENQNAVLAARERVLAARKREQEMRDGFSMAPFSNEIQLKDVSSSAHRNGFYADFNALATQYINQNKGNDYALEAFKKKNPLEQRKFLKENLNSIIFSGGENLSPAFQKAASEQGSSVADFVDLTTKNLTHEIDYLNDNATKSDLEFQRYKDIYNVPYWTNNAMNDFLISGGSVYPQVASHIQEKNFDLNDDPSKQKSYQFDKGASRYGAFMLGYKRDRNSEHPDEDFFKMVSARYQSEPVVDRFGETPLATRFKNKQDFADRTPSQKAVGFASQMLGVPYFNTMEQAREAGAIAPNEWFNPIQGGVGNTAKNIGEIGFDAAMLGMPWGAIKPVGKFIDKIPANAMVKTAAMGGLTGAKGTLEGEERGGTGKTFGYALGGGALGLGTGGIAYHVGRIFPKYSRGSGLDKEIKNIQAQFPEGTRYMTKDAIESELAQLDEASKAYAMRDMIFGKDNLGGLEAYARNIAEPADNISTPTGDVIDWARMRQKNQDVNNPMYYANVEGSPWETNFDLNVPLQNVPRPKETNRESASAIFSEATNYNPIIGLPSGTEGETRDMVRRAGEYIARNEDYEKALAAINVEGKKGTTDFGANIFNEIKRYEDEPIARFVVESADGNNIDLNDVYKEWLARNYPNGVNDWKLAQDIFHEKLHIANTNYLQSRLPKSYNTGRVEDTQVFKDVTNDIKTSTVLDEKGKKKLLSELNKVKGEGNSLDDVSKTIANVRNMATGNPQNEANVAGELRRQITPNLIKDDTFERIFNLKKVKQLKKDLEKKVELDNKINKLTASRQGFGPISQTFVTGISRAGGYGMANAPLVSNESDKPFVNVSDEQNFLNAIGNRMPAFGYFWDSPLMRMRSAGSFNIPMQEKK